MISARYHVGDLVRMRKEHPCGSDVWEVLRVGMDFRLKCCGCGHIVMLPRPQFERNVKELLPPGVTPEIKLRPRPVPRPRPRPAANPPGRSPRALPAARSAPKPAAGKPAPRDDEPR